MSITSPVAGWYTDPADPSLERYWDGTAWLDGCRPRQAYWVPPGWEGSGYVQPSVKSRITKRRAISIVAAAAAAVVAVAALMVHFLGVALEGLFESTAADFNICSEDTSGQAWCWDEGGFSSPGDVPVAVTGPVGPDLDESEEVPGGHTFTTLAESEDQDCALDAAGSAWCWTGADEPVRVPDRHVFTAITTSYPDICALDSAGRVWCWGSGFVVVPGDGGTTAKETRPPIEVPGKYTFTMIGGSCGLDADGGAWCWGDGEEGQLGNGDPHVTHSDKPVQVIGGHTFTTIVHGGGSDEAGYACGLDTAGKAWCWGDDEFGQLADGDDTGTDKFLPVPVAGEHTFTTISDRSANWCGLDPEGKARCEYWFSE